jgi:hypothetical protein
MIVIIGDSWGVGEWGVESTRSMAINGPGIAQFLNYNFNVLNLSKSSGSNLLGLDLLDKFLSRYQPDNTDEFYWIVTEPIRDTAVTDLLDIVGIESHLMNVLTQSFTTADQLAKKHNVNIKLIGGWCDIEPNWIDRFSTLKVVVPSWGSIVHKNYPRSIFGTTNLRELKITYTNNSSQKSEWLDIVEKVDAKIDTWKTSGWRAMHPDRYSHRKLRDFLYPELSEFY